MANRVDLKADEGSTFIIEVDFNEIDENGEVIGPITPKSGLSWELTDKNGNVINSRTNQLLTPAPSVAIPLTGADLGLAGNASAKRFLTINGTYDSAFGNDLAIRLQIEFQIDDLVDAV